MKVLPHFGTFESLITLAVFAVFLRVGFALIKYHREPCRSLAIGSQSTLSKEAFRSAAELAGIPLSRWVRERLEAGCDEGITSGLTSDTVP